MNPTTSLGQSYANPLPPYLAVRPITYDTVNAISFPGGTEASDTALIDPVFDVFGNRLQLIHAKIEMLRRYIEERGDLLDSNLRQLDNDECKLNTMILGFEAGQGNAALPSIHAIQLRQLPELQRERRQERASHFRDVATLKRDLIDALIEAKSAEMKQEMLSGFADGDGL